jgi:hypothetical protein
MVILYCRRFSAFAFMYFYLTIPEPVIDFSRPDSQLKHSNHICTGPLETGAPGPGTSRFTGKKPAGFMVPGTS